MQRGIQRQHRAYQQRQADFNRKRQHLLIGAASGGRTRPHHQNLPRFHGVDRQIVDQRARADPLHAVHAKRRQLKQPQQQAEPGRLRQRHKPLLPNHPAQTQQRRARRQHRAEHRREHVAQKNAARAQRQHAPAFRVAEKRLIQSHDEQREKRHRHRLADGYARIHIHHAIRRQRIEHRRTGRRPAVLKQPFRRRIHARRRADVQGGEQYVAHVGRARPAQQHQRKGIEKNIRIKDRRDCAITVERKSAHAHGELPAFQAVRQILQARQMIRAVVTIVKRRFKRHGARKQHGQTDKQRRRHVPARQPARRQQPIQHACADGKKQQRERVVLIFRRVEL